MNNLITLIGVGFVSWWATGIDDMLSFSLLLHRLPGASRRALILGNVTGVILLLALASLAIIGVLTFVPGLLEIQILGLPLTRLAGLIPMSIGLRELYLLLARPDDDDDDDDDEKKTVGAFGLASAVFVGMQIYLINSFDDLSVHLGVLSGAVKVPLVIASLFALFGYWAGVLLGEASSILSARWLARQMKTRRTLELLAALVVIGVGLLVLLGVFGRDGS